MRMSDQHDSTWETDPRRKLPKLREVNGRTLKNVLMTGYYPTKFGRSASEWECTKGIQANNDIIRPNFVARQAGNNNWWYKMTSACRL